MSTTVLTLENANWHLELLPEVGGSVLNLLGRTGRTGWRPVTRMVHPLAISSSSQAASFVLAPYSNRIRAARFTFEGREVRLRPTTKDGLAQHGDVRNRPWTLESQSEDSITLSFDGRTVPDLNWPWPFTMTQTYQLDGPSLTLSLGITSAADTKMPVGFGLHPYFARREPDGNDPRLSLNAHRVYDAGAQMLPSGAARPVTELEDFRAPRALGDVQMDSVFTDWDGTARLDWGTRALTMQAGAVFSHLVVFAAPDGSLALEPVSNATDGFNLLAQGVPDTGVRVLAPGESLTGAVTLTLEGQW